MSIPVDVDSLGDTLREYDAAYLLTSAPDGRVKAVSVVATLVDGRLRVREPGGGTLRNLVADPAATALFPPALAGGLTLLVDGIASADGKDVVLAPTSAVLHRAAS